MLKIDSSEDKYKQMDLKGESESDKDLIIDSLSESLAIHKDIVERIQAESDELQYRYETLDRPQHQYYIEQEKQRILIEQHQSADRLDRLETTHQSLISQLNAKSVDYDHMQRRFESHLKRQPSFDNVAAIVQELLDDVHHFCRALHVHDRDALDLQFVDNVEWRTEKRLIDGLLVNVWRSPIQPGVSLNGAFEKVYRWIEKRNVAWATRIKQHLVAFVVKESRHETLRAQQDIAEHALQDLARFYMVTEEVRERWGSIVEKAFELNVLIKCQDVSILSIEEGSMMNEHIMVNVNKQSDAKVVGFVISPPFVASSEEGFLVQAQVFCV
ncbi:MAG: hypothetical protein EXX96DRAFT_582959 [Benjaminiella poitrasii]|nr:MAG: hypothetical protein EXX96DRAFT_582959 [Benjaminiella poitrasii]